MRTRNENLDKIIKNDGIPERAEDDESKGAPEEERPPELYMPLKEEDNNDIL